jgi:hypothetical protein
LHIIIWEYRVIPERKTEFENIYSPDGAWAELFRKGTGFLGSDFLHDPANPQRYLTIDRWMSKIEYESFLARWKTEYEALDARCEGLTESEFLLGKWDSI